MDPAYIAVPLAAFVASLLTLFSGFGLGTLLMPVAAIFFPPGLAIALTAVVHLANNLFKFALLGRRADRGVVLRFGLPALAASLLGALLLARLADLPPLYSYDVLSHRFAVQPVNLVIGLLILAFLVLEQSPVAGRIALERRHLPFGGLLSGFFGGLSGHQGAFRAMFLLKAGLDRDTFIATGIVIAVLVDLARMTVYGWDLTEHAAGLDLALAGVAILAAFAGAWLGSRLLKKMTYHAVQRAVSLLLALIALALIAGAV